MCDTVLIIAELGKLAGVELFGWLKTFRNQQGINLIKVALTLFPQARSFFRMTARSAVTRDPVDRFQGRIRR